MTYETTKYWEERLKRNFNLRGVGNIGFSEQYNRWIYRRKLRCLKRALRGVHLQGKRVLDVGCGTGFFVKWYLEQGCEVTGIDITEISVKRLREAFPGEFYTRDITSADYPHVKTKFDILNMWDVIYHVVDGDAYERALNNIACDLGAGGLLLLTDFLGAPSNMRLAPHVLARCLETYKTTLPPRGFELVKVRPLYKFLDKAHFPGFDNYLGAIYYFADNLLTNIPIGAAGGVCLSIWRRSARGRVPQRC
jgi:SAM-dependent methyltransferase